MSQGLAVNPIDLKNLIEKRAKMLEACRLFFKDRQILEADSSLLSPYTNIDDHIDPIEVNYLYGKKGYLHTSPELALKKLIAKGAGDLYFLGHVFRDHEKGERHQVEFTMAEWYRQELTFEELIQETLDFIRLFVGSKKAQIFDYRDLFYKASGLWVEKATREELLDCIAHKIDNQVDFSNDSQSDLEVFIFSNLVEPTFEKMGLVVVQYYPQGQAALAKTVVQKGVKVAKRFEIYDQGLELANGYDEMVGDQELMSRYNRLNEKRLLRGQKALPIDSEFIALNKKLPDCRGVSVGFDRALMLYMKSSNIKEVQLL